MRNSVCKNLLFFADTKKNYSAQKSGPVIFFMQDASLAFESVIKREV